MKFEQTLLLNEPQDEFVFWTRQIRPKLALPPNVLGICEHGFTEMLNNALDHGEAQHITIRLEQNQQVTVLEIEDDGIGIFSKLRAHFGFDSDLHALIELVKGKLTVAPQAHSGEGIFFSSKLFDSFDIESSELIVSFASNRCDVRNVSARRGTLIRMAIANDSPRTSVQVFNEFCGGDEFSFYKTRFMLSLAALEGNLISRSQAKRVAARFEKFGEVDLDFANVDSVGQGFADELLRVWPLAHPDTRLLVINANENVSMMLNHIQSRSDLPQPDLPLH